ncbi:MAG: BppU family phage baseplate upper protein [Tetragenococcus koreensis]|nr:BppU family phage baseplate upper protein [Tetragenococcus koreensis]
MDIDIKKNGKLTLKDTPYFEPIDNTNISFTNMDIGTARITFRIMKHGLPLQVSDKNVYVYAYLESSNGSRAEVIELNFDDPINGLVSLQLDKEFLLAATNTTVKGQLYISMHKWNTVSDDFSDTVALQEFTFTVKDALVNQISGVTKIQYIRTFDQLKTEVKDRILELEEEVGRIETVSNELKELFRTTTQDIKDLKARTIEELDSKIASSNSAVDDKKTATLSELDTATTNAINQINNKKEEVLELITDNNLVTNDMFIGFQNDIQESIDETLGEYLSQVNAVRDDFQSTLDNLNWQKYKLTEEDGTRIRISDIDPIELDTGYYQMWKLKNAPYGDDSNGQYWNVDVVTAYDNAKQIIATTSYEGRMFKKNIHKGEDRGWKDLNNNQSDTGWIPYTLINGATKSTMYSVEGDNAFECAYRTIERGGIKKRQIRFNVKKLTQSMIFAQLPEEFVEHTQVAPVITPRNRYGAIVEIKADGKLVIQYYGDTWIDTDYIYGQYEWTE